jgi:hypothetical protein
VLGPASGLGVGRHHAGRRAEVSFRVRSPRIDGRHYCFEARVPEDAP